MGRSLGGGNQLLTVSASSILKRKHHGLRIENERQEPPAMGSSLRPDKRKWGYEWHTS